MKFLLCLSLALTLAACTSSGNSDPAPTFSVPSHAADNQPSECPYLRGTYENDDDPTKTVTYESVDGELRIDSTGGDHFTIDGNPKSAPDGAQLVAYCAHGKIYLQARGPSETFDGVISPTASGYNMYIRDPDTDRSTTVTFSKLDR
jgi:hypothetical protein